jgi:hypothetical protein
MSGQPAPQPAADTKPDTVAPAAAPAGPAPDHAREVQLQALYEVDPNTYRYADDGAFAKEHLGLKQAREAAEAAKANPADGKSAPAEGDAADDLEEEWNAEGDGTEGAEGEDEHAPDVDANGDAGDGSEIPDAPEGYAAPKIEGVEWTPAHKAALGEYAKAAHASGMSQEAYAASVKFYGEKVAAIQRMDAEDNQAAHARVQEAWGDHAKSNMDLMQRALRELPGDLGRVLRNARGPDGRRLATHPEFAPLLLEIAQARHGKTGEARLKELETIMRTDIGRYRSENLDAEHLALRRGEPLPDDGKSPREKEIERIMKTDIRRYWTEKLDEEHLEIQRAKEARKAKRA